MHTESEHGYRTAITDYDFFNSENWKTIIMKIFFKIFPRFFNFQKTTHVWEHLLINMCTKLQNDIIKICSVLPIWMPKKSRFTIFTRASGFFLFSYFLLTILKIHEILFLRFYVTNTENSCQKRLRVIMVVTCTWRVPHRALNIFIAKRCHQNQEGECRYEY